MNNTERLGITGQKLDCFSAGHDWTAFLLILKVNFFHIDYSIVMLE